MEVGYRMPNPSTNEVSIRFFDGNVPLSGGKYTKAADGNINFDFNFIDSATKLENAKISGRYNPGEKMFDMNNFDVQIGHHGEIIHRAYDSTGLGVDASLSDNCVRKVVFSVKNFFENI